MKKGQAVAVLALLVILVFGAQYMGIINFGGQPGEPIIPGIPGTTPPGTTPPATVVGSAAAIQFTAKNAISGASITSAFKVDFLRGSMDGEFNFLTGSYHQKTVDSAPEQSSESFSPGEWVVMHVACDADATGGTDHYDDWYAVQIGSGNPVYRLTKTYLAVTQSSPTYKYKLSNIASAEKVGTVAWVPGQTNYWDIGSIVAWPRISGTNLDTYASIGGTSLSSLTDGSTWDTSATASNMATDSATVVLKIDAGATDVCFGRPMFVVSSVGEIQEYRAFWVFSTAMTTINQAKLTEKGWKPVADSSLYGEKAFYKVVDYAACTPLKGNDFEYNIDLPVDSSSATACTSYAFKAWLLDFQLEDNVKIGSVSTSIPTAYGCVGEFGLDVVIHAYAYSVSSGAGATYQLYWALYTPA